VTFPAGGYEAAMTPTHGWLPGALPMFWPLIWIAVGLAIGIGVNRLLLRIARGKFGKAHPWFAIGIDAIRAGIVPWFLMAGIHAAMITSALDRNVVRIFDDVLLVLAFGSLTWVAARFAGGVIHAESARFGPRVLSSSLLATMVQTVIILVGIMIILQSLGVRVEALLTALGVGGLAVGLALQPTLGNLFGGLQLVASRALRPGDYVSVSGYEGFVEDITWRTTSIRDLANNLVIVPNQTIATSIFVNYRLPVPAVALEIPFTIKAGADVDKVEQAALSAANDSLAALGASTIGGVPPSVRFEQLTDGNIQARLVFRIPDTLDASQARNETVKRLFRSLATMP
jgi:small-conductance mechanosensitive channel